MLASDLPFPIARLLRQSRNAKSHTEAHNRAWFAWEASVRLAAVAADPERAGGLRHGTVGDWARLVPAIGASLGDPAIVDLHAHVARLADPSAGRRTSIGRREFVDALVAYRNRVIGHGPSRDEEFCRTGSALLRDALLTAWGEGLFLPPDARLVHVETIEIQTNGSRAARVFDLGLETPTVLDRESSFVPEHIAPHRVHLRRGTAWTALYPWLVFDPADGSFFWFQALKRRPDYIDYSSGRVLVPADLERLAPGAEVELDRRLRGGAPEREAAVDPERAVAGRRFAGFEILGEIGRGGMGVVHLANQVGLARLVALKTLPPESRGDPVLRARFHREIEALARCDHPNVVKIHASGEEDGVPYFAMEYVAGADLRRVGAGLARTKSMERALEMAWNEARGEQGELARALPQSGPPVLAGLARADRYRAAASLIRDAALGVQALHDCGIVHRDLSPANILVTAGETRAVVMDLGLALFEDRGTSLSRDAGRILGTLRYMSPEQLQRNLLQVDRRTDVYSLGAVLYELLADRPFLDGDTEARLIEQVLRETPVPVRRVDRAIPEDLARIVQVATDKDPRLRYDSAGALAADLAAFVEGRPVSARPPTPAYLLRRWVTRHPWTSAAAVLGLIAVSLGTASILAARQDARIAQARRDLLSDERRLRRLEDVWLQVGLGPRALEELDALRAVLTDMRSRRESFEVASAERAGGGVVVAATSQAIVGEHPVPGVRSVLQILSDEDAQASEERYALWTRVHDPERGLERRVDLDAERMRALLLDRPEDAPEWAACVEAIARSPRYAGQRIAPQRGLRPLRADPESGLWEFWHVPSGARPEIGADGRCRLREGDGIVLVLLPGGTFPMGAQNQDPALPQYDAAAGPECRPVTPIRLAPFFVSKFEMTQAQWRRIHLANPSYACGANVAADDELRPVEMVSWLEATRTLAKLGLVLPSEAQWEYACRAGTTSVWSSGDDPASQREHANLADQELRTRNGNPGWIYENWNDGHRNTGPVGSLRANPFGLHDVHGNVMEWVAEVGFPAYDATPREGDGLRASAGGSRPEFARLAHVARGGGWQTLAKFSRSSHRYGVAEERSFAIGVRPARALDPPRSP